MGVIIAVNSSSAPNPEEPAEKEARGMISTHEHEVNVIHTLLYAAFLHYYHAILFVLETFTCIVSRCVKPTTPPIKRAPGLAYKALSSDVAV